MTKVLVLYYSQAGQTKKAVDAFTEGLGKNVDYFLMRMEPREKFVFPWKISRFFRAFPRCVLGQAPEMEPLPEIRWEEFDLVVLAYQVWFLSPSLPMQGFLMSADAHNLQGKQVLTLATCRNLWFSAYQRVDLLLKGLGARPLGQITLCERSPFWASFVTTPRWMLTGRKNAFAFFPAAGIAEEEFSLLRQKGLRLGQSWAQSRTLPPVELVPNLSSPSLLWMDQIGAVFFAAWAQLIARLSAKDGPWRDFLLILFRLNLVALIVCVAPVTKLVEVLMHRQFKWAAKYP